MNITLKNIGTLKEATFNLDKDLIVFIGPNNTGKTYAAYCLYGLIKPYTQLNEILGQLFPEKYFDQLFISGILEINLEELFTVEKVSIIHNLFVSKFKEFLPRLFALDKSYFLNSDVDFNVTSEGNLKKHLSQIQFPLGSSIHENTKISYSKKPNSPIITIEIIEGKNNGISAQHIQYISHNIAYYIFKPFSQNWGVHFLPAERIGISVFSKDLFANRFTKTNEILNLDVQNRNKVFEIMSREFNAYSLIVQDAINDYENTLRLREKNGSNKQFRALANELEEKILKGTVSINNDGDVLYETDNTSNLKIQASGSIIKSLASFLFYLRYTASIGQLLIVDEPEINLHPDNQRLVARILAKLSKLGVKVIVSTHSDYFIKELNNLIMLNKDHPDTAALREKYGYDETEILDYNRVGAYLFKDNIATELKVAPIGMEAATIDEEINKLNNTATDIYWTLFEN